MKMMTYSEGIREGMSIRMREDPNVLLFGEDVGKFGGCFGVSRRHDRRVRPRARARHAISEGAISAAPSARRPRA